MPRRPTRYGGAGGDHELVVVLDCADLERAAQFWCAVLGYVAPTPPDGIYHTLLPADGDGIELLLQRVPDGHRVKNRMHLDLRVRDLEAEVERLLSLGARVAPEGLVEEHGWTWYVLLDPDDNEFCVLRPPADHWAQLARPD